MSDDNAKSTAPHWTDDNFEKNVKAAGDKPVFIDFYAEWCGPCKVAGPFIDELSGEYKEKAAIAKVNVDENQKTAQQYSVMSIPTVVILKGGKEVDRKTGFPGKQGYVDMLEKAM